MNRMCVKVEENLNNSITMHDSAIDSNVKHHNINEPLPSNVFTSTIHESASIPYSDKDLIIEMYKKKMNVNCKVDLKNQIKMTKKLDKKDRSRSRQDQHENLTTNSNIQQNSNFSNKLSFKQIRLNQVVKKSQLVIDDPIIRYYQIELEKKAKLKSKPKLKARAKGAGRPLQIEELDEFVLKELRANFIGNKITPRKMHVIEFGQKWKMKNPEHPCVNEFKHSKGWSHKFWIRNNEKIKEYQKLEFQKSNLS